jgi:hypothetical protein
VATFRALSNGVAACIAGSLDFADDGQDVRRELTRLGLQGLPHVFHGAGGVRRTQSLPPRAAALSHSIVNELEETLSTQYNKLAHVDPCVFGVSNELRRAS